MGRVIQLKDQINNSYFQLKNSVEEKLMLVEEKIKSKLNSDVELVQEMTDYHLNTGGKRLRALLTLGSAKLCEYSKGTRDVNLAACVELIHAATLMHDDVIDDGSVRRGKKTLNKTIKVKKLILVTWPIKYNVIILGIAIIFLGYYPTCLTVNFVWRRNEEIIKSINIIK